MEIASLNLWRAQRAQARGAPEKLELLSTRELMYRIAFVRDIAPRDLALALRGMPRATTSLMLEPLTPSAAAEAQTMIDGSSPSLAELLAAEKRVVSKIELVARILHDQRV